MSLEFRFQVFDSRFTNDTMTEAEMKKRTQSFALRILKLAEALPRTRSGNMIATQIVRSGTSVAANYRALCRSKSRVDFINKTAIVEEEADDTLDMIVEAELLKPEQVAPLAKEADELTAMLVA